jgi:hypothetical protein
MRNNNRNVQARLCAGGLGLVVPPRVLGDEMSDLERVEIGGNPPVRDTWIAITAI